MTSLLATRRQHHAPIRWLLLGVMVLLNAKPASATVQRRITVRTDPPGAQCYIDDYEIGITPCSTDFVYYGTRKVRLVKDGYETLTVEQRIRPPWFEWFPVDFVTENIYPGELRDEQVLEYRLTPQRIMASVEVLERAENLRRANRIDGLNLPRDAVGGAGAVPAIPAAGPVNVPVRPRNVPGYMLPGYTHPHQPGPMPGALPRSVPPSPLTGPAPRDPFMAPLTMPPAGQGPPVLAPSARGFGAPAMLPPVYTSPPQGSAVPIFDPPGAR